MRMDVGAVSRDMTGGQNELNVVNWGERDGVHVQ